MQCANRLKYLWPLCSHLTLTPIIIQTKKVSHVLSDYQQVEKFWLPENKHFGTFHVKNFSLKVIRSYRKQSIPQYPWWCWNYYVSVFKYTYQMITPIFSCIDICNFYIKCLWYWNNHISHRPHFINIKFYFPCSCEWIYTYWCCALAYGSSCRSIYAYWCSASAYGNS